MQDRIAPIYMLTLFGWKRCIHENDKLTHDIANRLKNKVRNVDYTKYVTGVFASKIPVQILEPKRIMKKTKDVEIYVVDVRIYTGGIVFFVKILLADNKSRLSVFGVSKIIDENIPINKVQNPIDGPYVFIKKTLRNKYVKHDDASCKVLYDGVEDNMYI